MLVVTAVFFCTLGLFFSSFSQRTLISTVLSYSSILISFIFFILCLFFISALGSIGNYPSPLVEDLITASVWLLFSTNPFFAAVMSEVILIEEQSLYLTASNTILQTSFSMPSPWIIYVVFYIVLTIVLISLSVYFVNRQDR